MYKHIICPIDGSSTSACGMTHAIALAKDQNAHLHFIYVVDNYFPVVDATGDVNYIEISEKLREHGKTILSRAKEAAELVGLTVNTKIVDSTGGQIHKSILNSVKKCNADLIVMGTHGLRGIERLVMGSDAETIVRTSPVPVLLVRMKAKANN